ncbi:MAG: hypothetical protein WAN24_17295 [Candidatus Acidiferrales bacterium]|jgi:hypothetical protein
MIRKNLFFVLAAIIMMVISGCRTNFTPPAIAVSLVPAPPASVEVGLSTSLSAAVTGDNQNAGVDWTVTCGSASCGTFNPVHTASGANTTYTAPSTPPTGGTVTVTASSTDSTNGASASATITISAVATASSLSGQYAFYFSGYDTTGTLYVAAGSLTLDGMGDVTAGEEDFNDANFASPSAGDALTGTYTVGTNGHGSMTLTATSGGVPDPNVGVASVQTLSFTVVNNNHALIEEFDSSYTSAGSLDLQTATAATAITGGYSFYLAGSNGGAAYVEGGVMTVDGAGDFTSTSDVDIDSGGAVTTRNSFTGTLTGAALDASGRGVLTYGGNTYAIYVIGPEVFRIVDIDTTTFSVVGSAFGQGAGAGSFSQASLMGSFVFNNQGFSLFGFNEQAGLMTTDGAGNISTGVIDYNQGGLIPPLPPAPDGIIAGTYAMAGNGYGSAIGTVTGNPFITTYGVYLTDPTLNLSDPNNTTSGTGSALFVELDSGSLGHGVLSAQTSTTAAAGNNAINLDGETGFFGVVDVNGQVLSNGSSAFAGTGDANELFVASQLSGVSLAGTFTPDATNAGRYTGTLDLNGTITPFGLVFYQASGGMAVHILEDPLNIGIGVIEQQQ